jgi:hypothetical protein
MYRYRPVDSSGTAAHRTSAAHVMGRFLFDGFRLRRFPCL